MGNSGSNFNCSEKYLCAQIASNNNQQFSKAEKLKEPFEISQIKNGCENRVLGKAQNLVLPNLNERIELRSTTNGDILAKCGTITGGRAGQQRPCSINEIYERKNESNNFKNAISLEKHSKTLLVFNRTENKSLATSQNGSNSKFFQTNAVKINAITEKYRLGESDISSHTRTNKYCKRRKAPDPPTHKRVNDNSSNQNIDVQKQYPNNKQSSQNNDTNIAKIFLRNKAIKKVNKNENISVNKEQVSNANNTQSDLHNDQINNRNDINNHQHSEIPFKLNKFYFGMSFTSNEPVTQNALTEKWNTQSLLDDFDNKICDGDSNLIVHIYPSLPRRQPELPAFSPTAAWRMLLSANSNFTENENLKAIHNDCDIWHVEDAQKNLLSWSKKANNNKFYSPENNRLDFPKNNWTPLQDLDDDDDENVDQNVLDDLIQQKMSFKKSSPGLHVLDLSLPRNTKTQFSSTFKNDINKSCNDENRCEAMYVEASEQFSKSAELNIWNTCSDNWVLHRSKKIVDDAFDKNYSDINGDLNEPSSFNRFKKHMVYLPVEEKYETGCDNKMYIKNVELHSRGEQKSMQLQSDELENYKNNQSFQDIIYRTGGENNNDSHDLNNNLRMRAEPDGAVTEQISDDEKLPYSYV